METKVHIEWTADKKVTVKINDAVAFQNEDFSGITNLGNKIAIKAGSYGGNATDVYLKDIHYTGQKEAVEVKSYAVSGKVVDAEGNAIANASVTVGKQTIRTNEEGAYSFSLKPGKYQSAFSVTDMRAQLRILQLASRIWKCQILHW